MRLITPDSSGSPGEKKITGRKRVLSFMSSFSSGHRDASKSPTSSSSHNSTPGSTPPNDSPLSSSTSPLKSSPSDDAAAAKTGATSAQTATEQQQAQTQAHPSWPVPNPSPNFYAQAQAQRPATPPSSHSQPAPDYYASSPNNGSPLSTSGNPSVNARRHRRTSSSRSSRPLSLVQTYQPPLMDITEDTIPELQPIFTFLNSHANKLYQEGYFLKLDDQNTHGRPNPDRTWTECFAQLVGTVLSLWDAAELDAAGEDGEVLPKFINLTDASIKMIESLPTRANDEQPLQNILSISTAGRNRYLLHFNSHHSLIQWTAGIRLAMYEHSTLQEAYTGALIAGKGKTLNNINIVMERSKLKTEAWVRVRFGAGVPWRRCWCVVTPPDEKDFQKQQKEMKKRSPYDRSAAPPLKGDIKFYDTKVEGKKQKKVKPIASITDSYSAYAIYPQAKSLIDASTLLKIEGNVSIHSDPPSSTEGFVFIMPEVHPMVSGFEMLLRFLFPTWDTYALYGRPGRLVASVLDPRSLMFAMPKRKRYGYLDIMDVANLIQTDGSSAWTEREWRKQLKDLTGVKMNSADEGPDSPQTRSRSNSNRLSYNGGNSPVGQPRARVGFADDGGGARTNRNSRSHSLTGGQHIPGPEAYQQQPPVGYENDPYRNAGPQRAPVAMRGIMRERTGTMDGMSSDDERSRNTPPPLESMRNLNTPEPVSRPPAFNHGPKSRPMSKPYHSPELRRANSRLSNTTLSQLVKAGGVAIPTEDLPASAHPDGRGGEGNSAYAHPSVHPNANPSPYADPVGTSANAAASPEALMSPGSASVMAPPAIPPLNQKRSRPQMGQPGLGGPPGPAPRGPMPPNPQQAGRGAPFNNFSRPDGARTPPAGLGRGYGPPPPPQFRDQRPQTPNTDQQGARSLPLHTLHTSPPRKPVGDNHPPASNYGSNAPDPGSFNQVRPYRPGMTSSPAPEHQLRRQQSERSQYDDASSTASPDYASTRKSSETQESVDRPRAGVLRTVGGAEPPVPPMPNAGVYDIPDVNFGPTINYGASPRKRTPTIVNPDAHRPHSPAVAASHNIEDEEPQRHVPWQPQVAQAVSPGVGGEEYVQQRAAHGRTHSGQLYARRSKTPEPGMGRTASQELLDREHRRRSSADLLSSRPGSRGANHALDYGAGGSHLSAREQEQIARMTGSPLLNVAGGGGKGPQSPGGGLVGAIQSREREREQMKQGVNSQAVQHAINQRQHHQHQQQQQQQMQMQMQMQMQQQQAFQQPVYQQGYQQQPMYGQQGMPPPQMGRGMGPGPAQYGSPRLQQLPPYGGNQMPPQQGGGWRPGAGGPMAPGSPGPGRMRQGPPPQQGFITPQAPYGGGGPRSQSPSGHPYGGGPPRGQPNFRPPHHGQAF